MKKFFISVFVVLTVLGLIFAYILFLEGAFDSTPPQSDGKPFEATMKCEAGKCAAGKCASGKCAPGKCAGGK